MIVRVIPTHPCGRLFGALACEAVVVSSRHEATPVTDDSVDQVLGRAADDLHWERALRQSDTTCVLLLVFAFSFEPQQVYHDVARWNTRHLRLVDDMADFVARPALVVRGIAALELSIQVLF